MLITAMVTSGSMIINDYYDFRDGVDTAQHAQAAKRALVRGDVRPESAKLLLKWLYAATLGLLCLVDSATMRLWVLANALLTYLYSVHFKPITGLKNVVCAAIVSMALGLGAIAAAGSGAALPALCAAWRPMAAVGGLIWHRELVMDIIDRDADAAAAVRTVPVLFGARATLWASMVPLLAGAAAAGSPGAALPFGVQALLSLRTLPSGFDRRALALAVEAAPASLLASLLMLSR